MRTLDNILVNAIARLFAGKKREKFLESVDVLNRSLAQDAWIKRGSVKYNSGFYQGLRNNNIDRIFPHGHELYRPAYELQMCLRFGQPMPLKDREALDQLLADDAVQQQLQDIRLTPAAVRAWSQLCLDKVLAVEHLDKLRPQPVVTAIGLSPKVTKTLTECNLDLHLPSIRMAKIVYDKILIWNGDGSPKLNRLTGQQDYNLEPRVEWSPGIYHNQSRFSRGWCCQACGKNIPSFRYVPVEAYDKKGERLVSLWLGCDCASNIFGIKDAGLSRENQTA